MEISTYSTLLSTSQKTAGQSKCNAILSLAEKSVEGQNFHWTGSNSYKVFERIETILNFNSQNMRLYNSAVLLNKIWIENG